MGDRNWRSAREELRETGFSFSDKTGEDLDHEVIEQTNEDLKRHDDIIQEKLLAEEKFVLPKAKDVKQIRFARCDFDQENKSGISLTENFHVTLDINNSKPIKEIMDFCQKNLEIKFGEDVAVMPCEFPWRCFCHLSLIREDGQSITFAISNNDGFYDPNPDQLVIINGLGKLIKEIIKNLKK